MGAKEHLQAAKNNKNDEFFTRLPDIEEELRHYRHHFAGKVVYCNTDDPAKSNFIKYFRDNGDALGIAGLLTNHLRADGTGDFRGKEALKKLKQADIVVSNPPFSLFRQYIAQLVGGQTAPLLDGVGVPVHKKFLIIGNINAVACKHVFPLIRDGLVWGGVGRVRDFIKPDGGLQKLGSIGWFTNLEHDGAGRALITTRKYDPASYPKYNNYDAINVDRIKDIPCDYRGEMGVPITFLMDYDTRGFDIIRLRYGNDGKDLQLGDREPYNRVIIQRSDAQ